MNRTTSRLLGLTSLSLAAAMASAQTSSTMATFADPAPTGATPLFTVTTTGPGLTGSVVGGWSGSGLTLQTPGFIGGGSSSAVHFTMSNLTVNATGIATATGGGPATIQFSNASNANLYKIVFNSATLNPFALGASTLYGDGVAFSGTNVPGGLTQERFAFSFANEHTSNGVSSYTASFTSSAVLPVPEPASIAALGLGAIGLLRRKRSR